MRFLLVTPFLPQPTLSGASQRTNHLARALSQMGEVDLLVAKLNPLLTEIEERMLLDFPGLVGVMETFGAPPPMWARGVRRLNRRIGDYLCAESGAIQRFKGDHRHRSRQRELFAPGRYDAIVGRYLEPLCRSGAFEGYTPLILDFDDPNHLFVNEAGGKRGPVRLHHRVMRRIIRGIVLRRVRRCRHVFFVSPADQALTPGVAGSVLPNIPFDLPENPPPPAAEPPRALFVATLTYAPNAQGIRRFFEHVWPRVRERVPRAKLRLVGLALPEDAGAWAAIEGVEVTGRVPELGSHYACSTVCIAPIHAGGGTNIKIIEAAAYGRASVVTRFAHRGFEAHLRDGECLVAADNDEQFAARLAELLSDPARATSMGAAGLAVARAHYSFRGFSSIVRTGVESAVSGSPR